MLIALNNYKLLKITSDKFINKSIWRFLILRKDVMAGHKKNKSAKNKDNVSILKGIKIRNPFIKLKGSLKSHLLSLFLVSLITTGVFISTVTYHYSAESIIKKVEQNISIIANQSATNINYKFQSEKEKTELLAGNMILSTDEYSLDEKLAFLKIQSKKNESIALCLVNDQGEVMSSDLRKYSFSDHDYFQDILNGETMMSDIFVQKDDSFIKIHQHFGSPVYNQDSQIVGVLINVKDAKEMSVYLGEIKLSEGSSAYILNKDNLIVADSNIQRVIDEVHISQSEDKGIQELLGDVIDTKQGSGTYDLDGLQMVVGYAPIGNSEYTLVVQTPSNQLLGDLQGLRNIIIAILLICTLLMSFIILYILNKALRPMEIMANKAEEISRGTLTSGFNNIQSRNNEIGVLAQSFHTMVIKLKEILENVKKASEDIYREGGNIEEASRNNLQSNGYVEEAMAEILSIQNKQVEKVICGIELLDILNNHLERIYSGLDQVRQESNQMENFIENSTEISKKLMEDAKYAKISGEEMECSIKSTSHRAGEIEDKIEEITKITKKINLVSFNAQIEAAKTEGDNSFDVVAMEINSLSQQTSQFTRDIRSLVKALKEDIIQLQKNLSIMKKINAKQNEGSSTNLKHFKHMMQGIGEVNGMLTDIKKYNDEIIHEKDEVINFFITIEELSKDNKEKVEGMKEKIIVSKQIILTLFDKSTMLNEQAEKLKEYSHYFEILN